MFRKAKLDQEMDEEMRAHIELRTQANLAAGMCPEEARRSALRSFGGIEQVKEVCRDLRGVGWIKAGMTPDQARYSALRSFERLEQLEPGNRCCPVTIDGLPCR